MSAYIKHFGGGSNERKIMIFESFQQQKGFVVTVCTGIYMHLTWITFPGLHGKFHIYILLSVGKPLASYSFLLSPPRFFVFQMQNNYNHIIILQRLTVGTKLAVLCEKSHFKLKNVQLYNTSTKPYWLFQRKKFSSGKAEQ